MAIRSKFYSDIDLTFKVHPLNRDISVLYDENAVKRNIKHVLMSNLGDSKFHPERNVGIRDLLFEPMNKLTTVILRKRIDDIITQYVPRVKIVDLLVRENTEMDGFDVELTFTTLNLVTPITTNIFLQRIR